MNSKSYKGFSNVVIILVGVLVVAILVGFFRVVRPFSGIGFNKNSPFTTDTSTQYGKNDVGILKGASENCDIAVTEPLVNSKVSNIIKVSGLYKNCGWDSTNFGNANNIATIGTIMVVDGKGNILTNTLTITSNTYGTFSTIIGLNKPSQTKDAVIVVRNADDKQPILLQIPVTISR